MFWCFLLVLQFSAWIGRVPDLGRENGSRALAELQYDLYWT